MKLFKTISKVDTLPETQSVLCRKVREHIKMMAYILVCDCLRDPILSSYLESPVPTNVCHVVGDIYHR